MNSDIYKQCKEVLRYHSWPTGYLQDNIDRHFSEKLWMVEQFGFREDKDWRIKIFSAANEQSRPEAAAWLNKACENSGGRLSYLDLNYVKAGKNKLRVTRVLEDLLRLTKETDEGENMAAIMNCCCISCLLKGDYDIHTFAVKYGDYVKNGRFIILSLNPYDFLTASTNAGFSSCLRLDGGEYANTVLEMLCSPNVMIAYLANPDNFDKKIARQWIYVNPTSVWSGRQYGGFGDHNELILRDFIQSKLCPNGAWVLRSGHDDDPEASGSRLKNGDVQLTNDAIGYMDFGYGRFTYLKNEPRRPFVFKPGRCLECGDKLDSHSGGRCNDCGGDGYRCENCGEYVSEDDYYTINGDGVYCEDCWRESTSPCEFCDDRFDNEDLYIVLNRRGNEVYACYSCRENSTWICGGCGCYVDERVEDYKDNGIDLCPNCRPE